MNKLSQLTCIDCEHCFPDSDGLTSMGICLLDPEFEPFLEDILEFEFEKCHSLIRKKRFDSNREACPNFSPLEMIEIGDLDEFLDSVDPQFFEVESPVRKGKIEDFDVGKIDFKKLPVEPYLQDMHSSSRSRRVNAVNSLGALTSLGNEKALDVMLSFLKDLGPPKTLEQARHKVEILRHFHGLESNHDLLDILLSDLENTASNNSTRQWITAILERLNRAPLELIKDRLQSMVGRKVFSQRLKKRVMDIIDPTFYTQ